MIRYDLCCDHGHRFDGWFRSSADFDAQGGQGLLACPVCRSAAVSKALMAPAVRAGGSRTTKTAETDQTSDAARAVALPDDRHAKIRDMLRELRAQVTANSEDVGERFPEVARRMHAEETEKRSVHGRATADEARALVEEGVEIHALPTFPDELN